MIFPYKIIGVKSIYFFSKDYIENKKVGFPKNIGSDQASHTITYLNILISNFK